MSSFTGFKYLRQFSQEAGENPFRHSPDDGVLELVGLDLPALPCNIQLDRMMGVGAKQVVDRHPARLSHLSVEPHGRTLGQQENERPYSYGREYWGPGDDVGQTAREILSPELDPYLFGGFPHSGAGKVGVAWLSSAARQGHVTGPGISRTVGPADEQDGIGLRAKNDGDGCPEQGGIVISRTLSRGARRSRRRAARKRH